MLGHQQIIDPRRGARLTAHVIEDRLVRARCARKRIGGFRLRRRHRGRDRLGGSRRPEKMRDVEFAVCRLAAEPVGKHRLVAPGVSPRHGGRRRRIVAKLHDRLPLSGIRYGVLAGGSLHDTFRIAAIAEVRPGCFQRLEPGLVEELEQSARRRRRRLGGWVKIGFPLRGREQIIEIRTGRLRGIADRPSDAGRDLAGRFYEHARAFRAEPHPMRCIRKPGSIGQYGKRELKVLYRPRTLSGSSGYVMDQSATTRHPRGGLYYEDFEVGALMEHRLTRTVTQMDNMLFSNMTLNPQPLHIDRHFCETETEWGQPLMNSLFTLGLMIGISVNDLTVGTTIANLGMEEVKFPHPLFEGDTVHCTTEVIGKRESRSRPGAGIVDLHHCTYNQHGKLVAECKRQAFMRMRPR